MKRHCLSFLMMHLLAILVVCATISARPYIVGVDISWVLEDEHIGATYWGEGVQKDIFQILKEHGVNFIRIRTFVDPCHSDGYAFNSYSGASGQECWCDLEHTIEIAERIKEAEMGFLLDFHMSDMWASIGEQHVPRAWANLNDEQMRDAAYEYTKHNVQTLIDLGLRPDMVQVGNEINSRMSGVSISNPDRFAALINAGVRGVRDVDPDIKIVMQHGRPRPDGDFLHWYNTIKNRVDYDFIGGSTYGTTNNGGDWRDMFGACVADGIPVMSLEYTANRTDLINPIMNEFPNNLGLGTFVWEPTRYSDKPMFDRDGNRYTSNSRLDRLLHYAQLYNATLPDFVQLGSGTRYSIQATAGLGGTIEQNPVGESLREGSEVVVTAVPLEGWSFKEWSGDHSGTDPVYTISSLNSDVSVDASFYFSSTDSSLYEGENAHLINSIIETTNEGFTGAGYANFENVTGSAVQFPVCVSEAGAKNVVIRYSNGADDQRPVSVSVNGNEVLNSLSFEPTGEWTIWNSTTISVELSSGINTITYTALTEEGGPNIDKMELFGPVSVVKKSKTINRSILFDDVNYTVQLRNARNTAAVKLYSVDGRLIMSRSLRGNQKMKLPVQQINSGRYILKMTSGEFNEMKAFNIIK